MLAGAALGLFGWDLTEPDTLKKVNRLDVTVFEPQLTEEERGQSPLLCSVSFAWRSLTLSCWIRWNRMEICWMATSRRPCTRLAKWGNSTATSPSGGRRLWLIPRSLVQPTPVTVKPLFLLSFLSSPLDSLPLLLHLHNLIYHLSLLTSCIYRRCLPLLSTYHSVAAVPVSFSTRKTLSFVIAVIFFLSLSEL